MTRRSIAVMRTLLCAGGLATVACQELLSVGTERLPPPDVEVVDEGDFSHATDPCGMLAASPAVRLSGSTDNSTAPAIATLGAGGTDPRLLVVWIEGGDGSQRVQARVIMPDGSFYGPLARLDAEDPRSVAIGAVDGLGAFILGITEGDAVQLVPLVGDSLYRRWNGGEPVAIGGDYASQRRWVIPASSAPRFAVLPDRVLVATLGPDRDTDGEADEIQVLDIPMDASLPRPCATTSPVPATAVDLVADGDDARLTWIADGELHGALLSSGGCSCLDRAACADEPWKVPAETLPARGGEGIVGARLRSVLARGSLFVAVPRSDESGAIWIGNADGDWKISSPRPRARSTFSWAAWEDPAFALGVEPGGRSLVLARPVSPDAATPTEIEIERGEFDEFEACAAPLSCLPLTADLRGSHEPELVPLADGFGVVWSDDEPSAAGTQREIYYAKVTCAALTR